MSSYGSYMTSCYAHYTPNEAHEENIKRLHSSHQHGHSQLFFIPTLSLVSTVTSFLPLMKPVDLASSTIGLAPKSIVRSHHRCSWRRQTLSLQPPLGWAERMVRTTERESERAQERGRVGAAWSSETLVTQRSYWEG